MAVRETKTTGPMAAQTKNRPVWPVPAFVQDARETKPTGPMAAKTKHQRGPVFVAADGHAAVVALA